MCVDASSGKNSNTGKDNIYKSDKDLLPISSETETKEPDLLRSFYVLFMRFLTTFCIHTTPNHMFEF